jgi:NAD(P)-dependent dehydrogenase (short-subunit alcohol dehydrogenase family)
VCSSMSDKKVWLVTGAGRGLGVDIAKAALSAGHAVVATGRNPERATAAIGEGGDLLAVKLDVTDPADAEAAVATAVDRFGRIDVLVNNAGNFNAGFFEELSPEEFRAQIETTFFGPVNVTRVALPVMRGQRSGLVITISSTAGLEGGEFTSAYAASKFGVEGWMESLARRLLRSGSARCWWSPASSAPSCSRRSRPSTPHPRSRTTPSGPITPSPPGRP